MKVSHHYDLEVQSLRQGLQGSFAAYLQDWLANQERRLAKGRLRPTYLREVRRYSHQYFLPAFGALDFEQIRTRQLTEFYLDLECGPKTTRNIFAVLKKVFNDAEREEVINSVPRFPKTARPAKVLRTWATDEEQEKIFALLDPDDFYFVFFQARHATTTGETRALRHGDLNLQKMTVTIARAFSGKNSLYPTKTGIVRELPLDPEWLKLYRQRPRQINSSVFVFLRNGKPWSESWASKQWKKAAIAAGFPNLSFYHGTRRSWALQKLSQGAPPGLIAAWLGDTMQTTKTHYASVWGVENLGGIGDRE